MGNNSNNPLKIINTLRDVEWATCFGWIAYSIGFFSLSVFLIWALGLIGISLPSYVVLCIIVGIQAVHSVFWLIKRRGVYNNKVSTVAFAINIEKISKDYYREIKKKFREHIINHKLDDIIKVKDLPTDINFKSSYEAEKFIKRKGLRLLIWGNTTEGKFQDNPFSQFNIKISYQYASWHGFKREEFLSDIGAAIKRKHWGVWDPNSSFNLLVVSGNIFEISLFALGACLITVPRIDYLLKAVNIFEKLDIILKGRNHDINFPNLNFVKQKIRSLLLDAYDLLLIFYWDKKDDLKKAIEYAEKAIKLDENNFTAHQNMAVFRWLNDEQSLARHHTNRAWRIRPGHPLPRFNKAFLSIYDRDFEQGLRQYKKIKHTANTNILNVISFIEKEFKKNPDNCGLLFVMGWLNIHYADQVIGIGQLKDFISRVGKDSDYEILTKEAQNVLGYIKDKMPNMDDSENPS